MEIENKDSEVIIDEKARLLMFDTELNYILDVHIKDFVIKCLVNLVPNYFFTVPASSTGKYHPNYALGIGGLVRHTQAAVRIAKGLFQIMTINNYDKDLILAALILHDSFKSGIVQGKYTFPDHPKIAATQIVEYANTISEYDYKEIASKIADLIITHMGQWNKDFYGHIILPVPGTVLQHYVHMCDYLASRKYLNFDFEVVII